MRSIDNDAVELRQSALHWLLVRDALQKTAGVQQLARQLQDGQLELDASAILETDQPVPGYPAKPELVAPQAVPRRAMNTLQGRAAMIHAMAHIEFNAINLALDALWRFADMPREYYADWLQVADEEAQHFMLLLEHLHTLGYTYGDFSAHNSLWEMAEQTQHDVLLRMALLPRTMEARGLDVMPGIKAKLVQAGDSAVAAIMDIILRDEIGHVAIGNRWFNYLCEQRGLDATDTYAQLALEHNVLSQRAPFNVQARRAAGFSDAELARLGMLS